MAAAETAPVVRVASRNRGRYRFHHPEVTVYRIATGTGFLAEQCFVSFSPFSAEMLAMALSSLNRRHSDRWG